jgi:tetratricopeptide (TPR) repeat protein
MWWDDQKFLKEAKVALKDNKYPGTTLFLGVANTLPEGLDTTRVKNDTTAATIHIRSNLELIKYLSANRQNKLKVESRYYPDDSHGSVPLIAEYDALHFIFADYPLKLSMALARDTGLILGDKIEKHYKMLSKQMGYDVNPPEDLLNTFGYQALAAKQFTKAGYMFKLNVRYYPESFNVYDSLGDYFNAIGDKNHAMDNYKKALSLHEYPETREKLMLLERT